MKTWHILALVVGTSGLAGTIVTSCKTDSSSVKDDQTVSAAAGTGTSTATATTGKRCNTQAQGRGDLKTVGYGPTCDELIAKYPSIDDAATPEDPRVLCPLIRILNRSTIFKNEIVRNLQVAANKAKIFPVTVGALTDAAREFGCSKLSCGTVAKAVSAGQLNKKVIFTGDKDIVDIGRLDLGKGVAHNCGFNFAYGDIQINPAVRDETLKIFESKAKDGKLQFADIASTKEATCLRDYKLAQNGTLPTVNEVDTRNQTLKPGAADKVEIDLIYTYLGGVDNGYILYSDVVHLFHAEMPVNKTKYLIDVPLFAHLVAGMAK